MTGNGLVYIGQTIQELHKRLITHRSNAKVGRGGCSSSRLFEGGGEVKIELIERCNTKEEMNEKERYWIENMECVNVIKLPKRTREERLEYCRM